MTLFAAVWRSSGAHRQSNQTFALAHYISWRAWFVLMRDGYKNEPHCCVRWIMKEASVQVRLARKLSNASAIRRPLSTALLAHSVGWLVRKMRNWFIIRAISCHQAIRSPGQLCLALFKELNYDWSGNAKPIFQLSTQLSTLLSTHKWPAIFSLLPTLPSANQKMFGNQPSCTIDITGRYRTNDRHLFNSAFHSAFHWN